MKLIKDKLKKWNKEHLGNIHLENKCIESQLEDLQMTIMKEGYMEALKVEEKKLQEDLDVKETLEETLWKSKSRNMWLKEGEMNSSFFFRATIQHRQTNRIVRIKKEDHIEAETHNEIEHILINHFKIIIEELDTNRSRSIRGDSRTHSCSFHSGSK